MDTEFIRKEVRNYQKTNREIEQIIKTLVKNSCSELDKLVEQVEKTVKDINNPITDEELDYFILNLPIQVYYAYEQSELLGLTEDIVKQEKNKKYAEAYAQEDGTIVDKKQFAELAIKNHQTIISIYNRAGKQIRNKLDIATEMLQSLKKVSTRRMSERTMEMTSYKRIQED